MVITKLYKMEPALYFWVRVPEKAKGYEYRRSNLSCLKPKKKKTTILLSTVGHLVF